MIELPEAVKDGVVQVAKLMALSALTAPKGRGVDNVLVKILDRREELEALAAAMDELAREYGEFFARDAYGVRRSEVVVLVGCRIVDFKLKQPKEAAVDVNLAMSLINLGIALGSAVKTASLHNVDNRIMYTIGIAAKKLNLLDADVIIGVPLSATSKNIYFDRVWPPK
ncbi:MAG: DUF2148 domain-containing protein [Sulfolobales archaeon]|nr:DUF2148 domain-containing protein [Sulfolobales archaeon]MCX8208558.1 DUF2148 domain-containing protein [Sulfolobales archaeon]MDW8010170.1 DUF2148 domain-containing protein [Sulfolobales archaeon]